MKPADELTQRLREMPLTERSGVILERLRATLAGVSHAGASDEQVVGILCRAVKQAIGLLVYPGEVAARASLQDLAEYLANEFEEPDWTAPRPAAASAVHIPPRPAPAAAAAPVPNVAFVLSSPRAGSTLLRVMLHGHPEIFSPPEMNLLPFESMGQRAAWFQQHGFGWMDRGVVATVAALGRMSAGQAHARIRAWELADAPVADVYRGLHGAAKRALLVDKSPPSMPPMPRSSDRPTNGFMRPATSIWFGTPPRSSTRWCGCGFIASMARRGPRGIRRPGSMPRTVGGR